MACCASALISSPSFFSRVPSERAHLDHCVSSFSSVCVASKDQLKSAAAGLSMKASVSIFYDTFKVAKLSSSFWDHDGLNRIRSSPRQFVYKSIGKSTTVEARLFGPAIFEAAKLRVLLMIDQEKGPLQLPRAYTLTHSDISAKITLAVSREVNKAQLMGWYSKLQRDEVLAEWRKTQGKMSLHVHCHISGGNFLHDIIAKLRFYIFQKELPVVLEAFMHGDRELFDKHPELQTAPVWVYFHSNMKEYNKLENWGPLVEATKGASISQTAKDAIHYAMDEIERKSPNQICPGPCECCSRHVNVIPLPESFDFLISEDDSKQDSMS